MAWEILEKENMESGWENYELFIVLRGLRNMPALWLSGTTDCVV